MRCLLYIATAIVTLTISAVSHQIRSDPYRFHYAALTGNLATVDRMLAHGTPVDLRDDFGETALMDASEGGHVLIIKRLLAAGADVNLHSHAGFTALMRAAAGGH